ncbi:MAG: DUF6624 domain-containing protein [Mucilaginibacter sp.]|uniref:DUF6624 domain-containing protein n=1 Tax=Mucilaginibacter sp. TaxID=1882438 RepID=UPI0031B0B06A
MKLIIVVLFIQTCQTSSAQTKVNQTLKRTLDSVYNIDQGLRQYGDNAVTVAQKDSIVKALGLSKTEQEKLKKYWWGVVSYHDSLNLIIVEKIFKQYGYPGKSLVGTPTNEAAFFVIQHSPPKIPEYFPLIKKAGENKELPYIRVATMEDRMLMDDKKEEQIYGTQISWKVITDLATGKKQRILFVWPIKDAKHVNERRKKAGFTTTVEENAKKFGVDPYKVYTLDEVQKLFK